MARAAQFVASIKKAIRNDIARPDKASRITSMFSHNIKGGWEVWLQVEAAYQIIADGLAQDFEREAAFPPAKAGGAPVGVGQKCDLRMTGAKGTDIFIELKTQRNAAYKQHVADFVRDVTKIKNLGVDWNHAYPAIALVVMSADKASFNDMYTGLKNDPTVKVSVLMPKGKDVDWTEDKLDVARANNWAGQTAVAVWTNSG